MMSDDQSKDYPLKRTAQVRLSWWLSKGLLQLHLNFSSKHFHCGRHRHFLSCKVLRVMKSLKLPRLTGKSGSTLISPKYTCHNPHCEECRGICDSLIELSNQTIISAYNCRLANTSIKSQMEEFRFFLTWFLSIRVTYTLA